MDNTCSLCPGQQAEIYCVEEDRVYCEWGSQLAHYPGTTTEKYSLERIVKDKDTKTVRIFTRLSEEILVLTLLYMIISHRFIQEDYLYNATICPVGTNVAYMIATFDAGLFYLAKGTMSWGCSMEDAYWRLWTDFWVRDVITSADTLGILLPTAVRAWAFHQVLRVSILPFFCACYSVAFMIASALEKLIPKVEPFITIENMVAKVDFLPFESKMPPETLPRERPSQDFVEAISYWKGRYLRKFQGFYNTFSAAFVVIIQTPLWYIFPLRLICMLLPSIGWVIRNILTLVGFGTLLDRHTAWFAESRLLDADITDTVLERAFSSAYVILTSGTLGNRILAPLLNLLKVVLGESVHFWVLLIPLALCGVANFAIKKIRKEQQEDFDKQWENGLREQYLGGLLYTQAGEPLGQKKED